jgi:rare lipoprotein A
MIRLTHIPILLAALLACACTTQKEARTPLNQKAVAQSYMAGASWYGVPFHGRKTANGERYNMFTYTAAHKTLPFGTTVRVTFEGKSVLVRVNDRGPYITGRDFDLSFKAAKKIGLDRPGHGNVQIEILSQPISAELLALQDQPNLNPGKPELKKSQTLFASAKDAASKKSVLIAKTDTQKSKDSLKSQQNKKPALTVAAKTSGQFSDPVIDFKKLASKQVEVPDRQGEIMNLFHNALQTSGQTDPPRLEFQPPVAGEFPDHSYEVFLQNFPSTEKVTNDRVKKQRLRSPGSGKSAQRIVHRNHVS